MYSGLLARASARSMQDSKEEKEEERWNRLSLKENSTTPTAPGQPPLNYPRVKVMLDDMVDRVPPPRADGRRSAPAHT